MRRFGVLLLQPHRQLFLIYVKMFIVSLTAWKHFAWWNLKRVTPTCSERQAKLRSWIFSEELMSENIEVDVRGACNRQWSLQCVQKRQMNFYIHFLSTFCLCASAESLSCVISRPPTIALPCFIPGLCALCTYIWATVPNCVLYPEMKKQKSMDSYVSKLCSVPTCGQV